jgi:hypothetical protein
MNNLILIFAIYGLYFGVTQTNGPWNIVSNWRNFMIRIPWIGVQFFKLISCPYCAGFWSGLAIYFLTQQCYTLPWSLCWGLTGGAVCLIFDVVVNYLHKE